MMQNSQIEGETFFRFDGDCFNKALNHVSETIKPRFDRTVRKHTLFHLFFLILASAELVFTVLVLAWLNETALVAVALSMLFVTLFAYFVLRLYRQAKKPLELLALHQDFLIACKQAVRFQVGLPEHHIGLAGVCQRFASALQGKEYSLYLPGGCFKCFGSFTERMSHWWHWEDVLALREMLLEQAIEEHIEVVRCEPTNLEVHAALANAYVMLSSLYVDHRKPADGSDGHPKPPKYMIPVFEYKFRMAVERAMEEFRILNDYAPDDPWIHVQLAYSYRDLQMPQEEIAEYEAIMRLRPDDLDALYQLGMRYFQQGLNAKGLKVYEELKHSNYKKAETLIAHYGDPGYLESHQ